MSGDIGRKSVEEKPPARELRKRPLALHVGTVVVPRLGGSAAHALVAASARTKAAGRVNLISRAPRKHKATTIDVPPIRNRRHTLKT